MFKKSLINCVFGIIVSSTSIGQYKQISDENFNYRANGALQFKIVEIKPLTSDPKMGNQMNLYDGFKFSTNTFRFYKADVRKHPDPTRDYNVVIIKPVLITSDVLETYRRKIWPPFKKVVTNRDTITGSPTIINKDDNNRLFWIREEDFNKYIESELIIKRYSKKPVISYGANVTLPFKMREKVSIHDEATGRDSVYHMKITPEFNLGGYIGLRWRISRYTNAFWTFPMATLGVTGVGINENNTIKEISNKNVQPDGLVLARTFSLGTVVDFNGFQTGIMIGWDKASGEIGSKWIYNDKPWISFTIGWSFIERASAKQ